MPRQSTLIIHDSILVGGGPEGDESVREVVSEQPNVIEAPVQNAATARVTFAGANIIEQHAAIGGITEGPTPLAVDPLLEPLANRGGHTLTFGLQLHSPALDKGGPQINPLTGASITTDQRGLPRPVDRPGIPNGSGNGADLGAFELQCSLISFTSHAPANGAINTPYSHTFSVTGGTPGYTFTATGLPPGLTLSPIGQLTGTPTMAGSFTIVVTGIDANGCGTAPTSYSIVIAGPACALTFTSGAPPSGAVNAPYAHVFTVSGGTPGYTFTATGLPPGLTLSPSGQLKGTPTTAGTFSIAVTAVDANGCASPPTSFTIVIVEQTCGVAITPETLRQPYVAIPYLQALDISASGRYAFSVTAGALPSGLQLVSGSSGAVILGIPKTPGTYTFTITATKSGANCQPQRTYTMPIPKTVVPLLTCVQRISSNSYRAAFGFDNSTGAPATIPVGADNYFTPGAQNRGQVTAFPAGTVTNAFTVTFTASRNENDLAVWFLRGPDGQKRLVTVTRDTFGCQ